MKSRVCYTPVQTSFCGNAGINIDVWPPRPWFLKVGIFLIVCWMLSSLWLISTRRSERSSEEVVERKATVALVLPEEFLAGR